ncbi:MAG: YSC84-related protein [Pigmentiphaga sp.]|uniref:BPSL1445 family SYLF domain-containing lipoprotein n=1 Tax=Pigmentiphaga sp. TaxID=1977564 RepID=UPI0029AA25D4|nr:YSC84-related protein [Pigmentiphaga sp.]MDX3907662.1 YSC84-related protein [Pigmentiphaga sp.]
MKRRQFLYASAAAGLLVAAGCTTTNPQNGDGSPAARRARIDSGVNEALNRLYATVQGARELGTKAEGILVFPSVISAGLVVGGEYGEGALREGARTTAYYSTASGSFGFQAGAQSKALIFMFMNQAELDRFKASKGWTAGVDGSVAVVKAGVNAAVDVNTARAPVVAFALTNAGLMANLTVEGTKITRLDL